MRKLVLAAVLLASTALAQQPAIDANSIVVTSTRSVVLAPTEVTFAVNVSADVSATLEQVLAAVDFGLTSQDLLYVSSYPVGPYPGGSISRITYTLRLAVPFSRMKDTVDKLEKLRKSVDTNMDLTYNTQAVGPNQAAIDDARERVLPDLISDAKKRAQSIASAAGLKVGAVQAVSEGYSYPAGPSGPSLSFSLVVRFAAQ